MKTVDFCSVRLKRRLSRKSFHSTFTTDCVEYRKPSILRSVSLLISMQLWELNIIALVLLMRKLTLEVVKSFARSH